MAKKLKEIGDEYRRATRNSFAEVVRSAGDIQKGFQGIASEMTEQSKRSVGRALDLQTRIAKRAYDTYASEVAKLGQMMFSGYQSFLTRTEEQLPDEGQSRSGMRRTAAHRATSNRRTGAASRRKSLRTRALRKGKRSR